MSLNDIAQKCKQYAFNSVDTAANVCTLFVGLGKVVAPYLALPVTIAGSAVAGTFIAIRIVDKRQENQVSSKKPIQKVTEPVQSKAVEPKIDPAKSKAAETPVKNEEGKKYYVKKVDPAKSKVAEKSAQGVADSVKSKLHESFPNKVIPVKLVDSSHDVHTGDSFEVSMTGVTEGAAAI